MNLHRIFSIKVTVLIYFNKIFMFMLWFNSYLDCVTKLGVVHGVHALLLRYYGNEAVAPLDLLGDVGGPGLRGDPGRLHDSLQDDDHLQVAALQLHGRQVVQRAESGGDAVSYTTTATQLHNYTTTATQLQLRVFTVSCGGSCVCVSVSYELGTNKILPAAT